MNCISLTTVVNLSDTGKRWESWGVYPRLDNKQIFQYSVDDYIKQNLLVDLDKKLNDLLSNNRTAEAQLCSQILFGLQSAEQQEVTGVMKAFYTAFNKKDIDNLRVLWLPDETSELVLPDYRKAVSSFLFYYSSMFD